MCGINLKTGLKKIGLLCLLSLVLLLPLFSDPMDEEIKFLETLKIELNSLDNSLLNIETLSQNQELKINSLQTELNQAQESLKKSDELMKESEIALQTLENKYQTLNLQLMQESNSLKQVKTTNIWLSIALGIVAASVIGIGITFAIK